MKYIKLSFFITILAVMQTTSVFAVSSAMVSEIAPTLVDHILISEIENFPSSGNLYTNLYEKQWFELYNPTGLSVNISGWTIRTSDSVVGYPQAIYTFPSSATIASGDYLLVANDSSMFQQIYSSATPGLNISQSNSSNMLPLFQEYGGGSLVLKNSSGTVVDFVAWNNHISPWVGGFTSGKTFCRVSSEDTNSVGDWSSCTPNPNSGSLSISVSNVTPTDITLDGANFDTVDENTTIGTSISNFVTVDVDVSDIHTYTLVSGTGSEDNSKFTISGSTLKLNFTPDFENPISASGDNSYILHVQTNDGNGGAYSKNFIITVNDINEGVTTSSLSTPVINPINEGDTSIAGTADTGTTITLNTGVCINEPVVVSSGVWSCALVTGDMPTDGYTVSATSTDDLGNASIGYLTYNDQNNTQESTENNEETNVSTETSNNNQVLGGGAFCPVDTIIHENMKAGDSNLKYSSWQKGIITEVKLLQAHMNRLGFNAGAVDGILGLITDAAIKQMQAYLVTKQDGLVGPLTREKLNNSCGENQASNGTSTQVNYTNTQCAIDYSRNIKWGLKGDDVKQVQVCMNSLGYSIEKIDGIYGAGTYSSITSFQGDNGLIDDGVIGTSTINLLHSL